MFRFLSKFKLYKIIFLIIVLSFSRLVLAVSDDDNYYSVGGIKHANVGNSEIDLKIAFKLMFNGKYGVENFRSDITIYEDMNALVKDLTLGKLDIIYTSIPEYLKYEELFHPDVLIALTALGGNHLRQFVLYVHKTSNIKTLSQLRDKKLAHATSNDLGHLFLDVELLKQKLGTNDLFFKEKTLFDTSHASILSVFFKKHDAVLTTVKDFNIAAELNPQIAEKLEPILISEYMLGDIVTVNKNLPKLKRERFKKFCLSIHETAKGAQLLKLFHTGKMVDIEIENFKQTRILLEQKESLLP